MAIQAKGSDFERQICKMLSLWVSKGERPDVFWRTAMSGGRATVHRKRGTLYRQSGDICSVSLEGHGLTDTFYFELKNYKNLDILSFLLKDRGQLSVFWKRAKEEARYYRLRPVLILKQNFLPVLVVVNKKHFPKRWLAHTGSFCINVAHKKCSIYKLSDILLSSYDVLSRERLHADDA